MIEIKWDIRRGADIYRQIFDSRLKSWISTGKIKTGEVIVWRSGFSGWRKAEEVEELIPYFRHYERTQLTNINRRKLVRSTLSKKKQIKTILIIDNERDLCQILGDTLISHGYDVKIAHTKREAISSLKSQTPDMAFCDLKLPDGDGMRIIAKIRKISPGTIVNIISAYGSEESRDEAIRLGAHGFIDKPFSEEDILRNIRECCKVGAS